MSLKFLAFVIAAAFASSLDSRSNANNDPCEPCHPPGATASSPPAVGPNLNTLYVDVLSSVKGVKFHKRSVQAREEKEFCCRQSLDCVTVQNLNIAMCYDKFTTNYAFPDGSYGSLTTGDYKSGSASVNLLTGQYTNGNENGNIYASNPSAKPNTATLSIPPQFTGTGVGTAIPGNQLGSLIVHTTMISGTAVQISTTMQATTTGSQTASGTGTSKASSSTGKSTAAAGHVSPEFSRVPGITVLGSIMWALFAL